MRRRTVKSRALIVIKQLFDNRSCCGNKDGLDDRSDD